MIQKNKAAFFIVVIFSFLQFQPLQTMDQHLPSADQLSQPSKMSLLNPLSWVYGLCSVVHYRFGWLTEAAVAERIKASRKKLKIWCRKFVTEVLNASHENASRLRKDGKLLRKNLNKTNTHVVEFRESILVQMAELNLEGQRTQVTLEKTISKLKKAALLKLSKTRKTINSLDQQFTSYGVWTKEEINTNASIIRNLGEKFKREITAMNLLRQEQSAEHDKSINELNAAHQEFRQQITNELNASQQTTEHCKEECEKEQKNSLQTNESVKSLLQELQENALRMQHVLNKLPNQPTKAPLSQKTPSKPTVTLGQTSNFPQQDTKLSSLRNNKLGAPRINLFPSTSSSYNGKRIKSFTNDNASFNV